MKVYQRIFALLWGVIWYTFASATVLIAVSFSLLRLFLPLINQYTVNVENYVSQLLGQPVRIQTLDAEWHGFGPSLVFNNLELLNHSGTTTIAQFSKAKLGLDILDSLQAWQVRFNSLALKGADLSLVRHEDGRITLTDFDFSTTVKESDGTDEKLPLWLLAHGRVSLEINNLLFEDKKYSGRSSRFSDISILVRNLGDRHLVDCVLIISNTLKENIMLSMDITGNVLNSTNWEGQFYLSGNKVDLSNFYNEAKILNANINAGSSSFKLWGNWKNSKLDQIKGEFDVKEIRLTNKQDADFVSNIATTSDSKNRDNMSGELLWQATDSGWRLDFDHLKVQHGNKVWPDSQMSFDYIVKDSSHHINVNATHLELDYVAKIASFLDYKNSKIKIANTVNGLNPQGLVENISMHLEYGNTNAFQLQGQFRDVSITDWYSIPAVTKLSGDFSFNESQGLVNLDSKGISFNFPRIFRSSLYFDQVRGSLAWNKVDSGWKIDSKNIDISNQDAQGQMRLQLEIPNSNESPNLTMVVNFQNGNAKNASYYLPANILPKAAVNWLDQAFKGGIVTTGGFLFNGALNMFPFDHGTGVFEVRFNLQKGIIDYAQNWPQLEEINTEVVFRGRSMAAIADYGRILKSDVSNLIVEIPDITKKPFKIAIRGKVAGTTQDKIDFMETAPHLKQKYGHILSTVSTDGNSILDLDINLEISKAQIESQVNGTIDFKNNNLKHKVLGNILSNVTGKVDILPVGFRTSGLQSNLFGQQSVIEIDTLKPDDKSSTDYVGVKALGKFNAMEITEKYMPALSGLVSGDAKFNISLELPLHSDKSKKTRDESYIDLKMESLLRGVDIKLPPPFNKISGEEKPLVISAKLKSNNKTLYKIQYADRLNAVIEMQDREKSNDELRGEIRFGQGEVFLPDDQGLNLTGHLGYLSFNTWLNLVNQINATWDNNKATVSATYGSNRVPISDYVQSADLLIDEFEFFGQKASQLNVKLTNLQEKMQAQINSKEIRGTVSIPQFIDSSPIEMDLDYWKLTPISNAGAKLSIDPRNMPAISAVCKSVTYENRNFGSVRLKTSKIAEGVRLEQLVVKPRSTVIVAFGKWIIEGGKQKSSFELHLDSKNLGETMEDLDYLESISNGKGKIDAAVEWPGAITDFNLEQLKGEVQLHFKDGRLLEVDPGRTGRRIFGLFSFQTVPRRLLLDFSDVYKKGLSFDSIEGEFNIEGGDAYTSNFFMLSSAGTVEIAGRIGIANRDYDQNVKFTPQAADMVSILGLILLPGTPWGFILPQMFKEDINNAITFSYALSGDWENPQLVPITAGPEAFVNESFE